MDDLRLVLKFWEPNEKKFYNITLRNPVPNLEEEDLELEMQKLIGVFVPATCVVDEAIYVQTTYDEVMNLIDNN